MYMEKEKLVNDGSLETAKKSPSSSTSETSGNKQKLTCFLYRWMFARPRQVFMNVEEGETKDDVIVGAKAFSVDRSILRPFEKIK